MLNKKKTLIISFLITIIAFGILVKIEKSIANPKGQTLVYTAKDDITKNTYIDESNFDKLFSSKKINRDNVLQQSITSKEYILNKYVSTDIFKGEQIIENRLIDDSEMKKKYNVNNPRLYGLKFDNIADIVGLQVRVGDELDLYTDNKKLEKIYVSSILSNGKPIKENANIDPSNNITVIVYSDKSTIDVLDKAIRNSSLKGAKIVKNK